MTMQATALIAEDEPLLADALKAELARQWPTLHCVATARNGLQAIELATRHRPDVAFLDIRMPGASGLEVAQAIAEDWDGDHPPPLLVFVTAYDEFAVQAFEQAAVDYLLKPVQPMRLAQSLQRVRDRLAVRRSAAGEPAGTSATAAPIDQLVEQLRQVLGHSAIQSLAGPGAGSSSGQSPGAGSRLRSIKASVGDTVHLIPVDQVIYLQANDKYVSVVTRDAEYLIREPLKELLPRLDPSRFVQVHRGTVVNLDEVAAAVRDDRGRTQLRLRSHTTRLPVSRLYQHLFKPM